MSRLNVRLFPHRLSMVLAVLLWIYAAVASGSEDDFTLPDMDGRAHTLSDYRGQWVLVNYWATWCPPCLEELPELEVFHSGAAGKAVVLGVNMEAIAKPRLRAFVEQQFLSFPILVAGESPSRDQLIGPVEGMPTSYLVTPEGEVVARQVGQITAEAINAFIDRYEDNQPGGEK